jgi:rhodanese-related sulfurtransferase
VRPGPILSVDAAEAGRQLADPDGPLLLDVREPGEFAEARIDGAVLVPLGQLQARAASLPDRPTIVMCHSGSRSMAATNYLRSLGRDAVNLDGGIVAWARAGLPYRSGPPGPGEGELPAD